MQLFIDKHSIGSKENLLIDSATQKVVKIDSIPKESNLLVFGSESLKTLAGLHDFTLPEFPSTKFKNHLKALQSLLNLSSIECVPWSIAMPSWAYNESLEDLVKGLLALVSDPELDKTLSYFNTTFKRGNKILEKLIPAFVNEEKLEAYLEQDPTNAFLPEFRLDKVTGFCRPVVYSRTETVSGRLKVISGPNILHLKKDYKNILQSRFGENGMIVSLDCKSLEPRTVLSFKTRNTGEVTPRDMYEVIKDRLFKEDNRVTREMVKSIVISGLYGVTVETLQESYPLLTDLRVIVPKILDWFEIETLKERLFNEALLSDRRYIWNFYGRKVSIADAGKYMYLNRYIQSTSVDIALLGFSSMIDYVNELGREEEILPLFVNHDALILDVHKNAFSVIPTLCKIGAIDISGIEHTTFYVQSERIS